MKRSKNIFTLSLFLLSPLIAQGQGWNVELEGLVSFWNDAISVTLNNDCAYIASCFSGLRIVDITNPASPVEIGYYDTPGNAYDVAVSGDFAYVADYQGLRIINIINPTSPQEAGFVALNGTTKAVAVMGNYAYTANLNAGLRIVDISNPTIPFEVGFCISTSASGIAVTGNFAYLGDTEEGLLIIDISNPALPVEVSCCIAPTNPKGIAVAGDYAYVADNYSGLRIINIANPAHPAQVGLFNTPGQAVDVEVAGNLAYVADKSGGLRIIDISNPSQPVEVGVFDQDFAFSAVALEGEYCYLTYYSSGLAALDISQPDYGMSLLDLSVPLSPVVLQSYMGGGCSFGFEVEGNYAYLSCGCAGMQIFDISNAPNITIIGRIIDYYTGRVSVCGNRAYVGEEYSSLLHVYDVSNPSSPVSLGSYNPGLTAYNMDATEDYLYLVFYDSTLRIIDVSDPGSLFEIANYHTLGPAVDVTVIGNSAFVSEQNSGMQVLDISDPTNIVETGFYNTPGTAWSMEIEGNLAYVGDWNYFEVLDCSEALGIDNNQITDICSEFALYPVFPNPCNAIAELTFALPVTSAIRLSIIDALGRETAKITSGVYNPGTYKYCWEAEGFSSGVYYARLSADNFQQTQKIILLK